LRILEERAIGGEGGGPVPQSRDMPTSRLRNLGGASEEAQGRVEWGLARRRFGSTFVTTKVENNKSKNGTNSV